jgi:hypothetical protein
MYDTRMSNMSILTKLDFFIWKRVDYTIVLYVRPLAHNDWSKIPPKYCPGPYEHVFMNDYVSNQHSCGVYIALGMNPWCKTVK